ncbi:MAG: FAD:protein FMN transferase [Kangiellaceae bacterium]|nr:FAD:protein FMN transferase [Kangiellaceae bacterium]
MKLFVCITVLFFTYSSDADWYEHSFDVMGTRAKVEFESDSKKLAAMLVKRVEDEMNRIDQLMSPFKETSELSKINTMAFSQPVEISREMFSLLEKSLEYSRFTSGAFDITFSSVGYLYDYRQHRMPSNSDKTRLKESINYRSISLNANQSSVRFLDKNTRIDLGGIAKGHAVDQCIGILLNHGIKNAFVNAGGDSRVIGKKQDRLWYIGIRHPRDEDKLIVNLPLEEVSISTSGDYERFFIKDNVRYHHIIDPKTGDSARHTQSVTILASNSVDADALSTSIFVMGVEDGMKLVNQMTSVSAIIIDQQGKMIISNDLTNAK